MRYAQIVSGLLLCLLASACTTTASTSATVGVSAPGVSVRMSVSTYPDLVLVPGYPVYYAPGLSENYFFYDGMYWVYQDDRWYSSGWYNGPWNHVGPHYVPVFILRIPVYYYRRPPVYFRGWRSSEPPRWGEHWGGDWEGRHRDWNRWDARAVPAPAPRPDYQRRYSGGRYPRPEQQHELKKQHYRYQSRDAVEQPSPQRPNQRQDQRQNQQQEPRQDQRERSQEQRRDPRPDQWQEQRQNPWQGQRQDPREQSQEQRRDPRPDQWQEQRQNPWQGQRQDQREQSQEQRRDPRQDQRQEQRQNPWQGQREDQREQSQEQRRDPRQDQWQEQRQNPWQGQRQDQQSAPVPRPAPRVIQETPGPDDRGQRRQQQELVVPEHKADGPEKPDEKKKGSQMRKRSPREQWEDEQGRGRFR